MPTSPHLTDIQLAEVSKILDYVRSEITRIAGDNQKLAHHARRYISKRLEFDERGTPAQRNKVRMLLLAKQQGKCAECGEPLPAKEDSDLDRFESPEQGYSVENTRLIHRACHRKAQAAKNYS